MAPSHGIRVVAVSGLHLSSVSMTNFQVYLLVFHDKSTDRHLLGEVIWTSSSEQVVGIWQKFLNTVY
ncbi:hypothetical protein VTO42DRAFT_8867 [Malbranchea cinnamomea]